MSTADSLRDRASQFRQALPPRRMADAPRENGQRIGTLRRSADEEIRINWCEYEGKPFLSIRMWCRNRDDMWFPDRRGITIRIRELADVADGLAEAELRMSREHRPMPGRPVASPDLPPASPEHFDETEGGAS